MKRIIYISILSMAFTNFVAYADVSAASSSVPNTDAVVADQLVTQELEKQANLKSELESLTQRLNVIRNKAAEAAKVEKKVEEKKKELSKQRADLTKEREEMEKHLKVEKDARNRYRAENARIAGDTLNFSREIAELDRQLAHYNQNVQKIEDAKDGAIEQVIEANSKYLHQPFAEMTDAGLLDIVESCRQYDKDKNVREFIKKVNLYVGYKRSYDNAKDAVKSKFDKSKVAEAGRNLQAIPEKDITDAQKSEITKLNTQLQSFEPGLVAFKEFIAELNRRRDGGGYTSDDYKDEYPYILKKNGIGERIEAHTMLVPYLKDKFTEYTSIIESKPNDHPAIETEILGL